MPMTPDKGPPNTFEIILRHRGLLRIRVGDYRIVYEIRDSELIIVVVTLDHHGRNYDRL